MIRKKMDSRKSEVSGTSGRNGAFCSVALKRVRSLVHVLERKEITPWERNLKKMVQKIQLDLTTYCS
jgi:hypothetical protein